VAGPIERATNLLPQFSKKRVFKYQEATDGLRQILWGLVKKVLVADSCARYVDIIFENPENCTPLMLIFGAVLFAVQIYGDFSGYSDIAIGTAKLFGFNLMQNFAHPYFSRDIAEFWRRWHISLSTWFRDYLYIPLGGSRGSKWQQIRNVFVIFLVSGFWHGANWTFLFWGFLNALFFLPLLLRQKNRVHVDTVAENRWWPSLRELFSMGATFTLTTFAWIFFRAATLEDAFYYVSGIFSNSKIPNPYGFSNTHKILILCILSFMVFEWFGRRNEYAIQKLGLNRPAIFRYSFYYGLVILIFLLGAKQQSFIYFQF
jgi:D-alanyl-lipoteichoic acid acyltransferase DltB (MBOAT superfamily)